ncbi:MAG: hypothetical protein AAB654_23315 [Acidobacteriota bacterium]
MKRRAAGLAAFCALALLFLIANRGAYQGYFQDDEFDNIGWTREIPLQDYLPGLLTLRYSSLNFRPVGHGFFSLMGRWADLRFPPYVAAIHALHLLNALLVWLLLRRLKLPAIAAGAGTVFFAFHMGVFDALWKPMYVFDLLCALFSLTALLAWTDRRWVLSFVAFWLAYKSKELAVMLPLALAAYELWLSDETGSRRWLRLAPFFAVSLTFGLQAILGRHDPTHAYRMELSLAGLAKTIPFYSSRIFLIPYAGLALLALPMVARDRRVWFGLTFLALFLAPLATLPGRMFGAYLYLPLAGLAVAVAAISARAPAWSVAAFFLIWLPWNYHHLRIQRRAALTIAQENRAYAGELFRVAATAPNLRVFLYDGAPQAMARWGVQGALQCFYRQQVEVFAIEDQDLARATAGKDITLLSWDPIARKILPVRRRADEPPASFIRMERQTPSWQLLEGWFPRSGFFRWTRPTARATLLRPAGARRFELIVNAGPPYIAAVKRGEVEVFLNGVLIGRAEFTREGWQTVGFDLEPAPSAVVEVTFRAKPELRAPPSNPVALGLPIGGFGFPPPESDNVK